MIINGMRHDLRNANERRLDDLLYWYPIEYRKLSPASRDERRREIVKELKLRPGRSFVRDGIRYYVDDREELRASIDVP